MRLNNESGFTLIELLITVAIVSVAIGLSSFGIGIVFDSSVSSYAEQYKADLREARNGAISTLDERYTITWFYSATDGQYYYEMRNAANTLIKTVTLHRTITVSKYITSTTTQELKDFTDVNDISIKFSPSSGKVITNGAGVYLFESNSGANRSFEIKIISGTGGIFLDEK